MTLTTSYKLSKQWADLCKEKGFKMPESYFQWKPDGGWHIGTKVTKTSVPAYTSSEWGEVLPTNKETWQTSKFRDAQWFITDYAYKLPVFSADTEADARCKMAIYLLENNLLT